MCPLLSQEMARQRRENLQREAIHQVPFAPTYESGYWNHSWDDASFLFPLFERTGSAYGRPIVRSQRRSGNFGRRLMLSLVLLCIFMPLLGMALGISLPILVMGSLFCLLVLVLSIVLGRV